MSSSRTQIRGLLSLEEKKHRTKNIEETMSSKMKFKTRELDFSRIGVLDNLNTSGNKFRGQKSIDKKLRCKISMR